MQVAVIGAGAVGCYYGGLLLRAGHDVTFIGRQPHVDAINAHGLLLDTRTSKDTCPPRPRPTQPPSPRPIWCWFASSRPIPNRPAGRSPDACGRKHPFSACRTASTMRSVSRAVTGHAVIPVVVYVGSEMAGPGHVRHHGGGDLAIGASAASEALAQTLEAAGVHTTIADDIEVTLWSKLVINCAFNALSAVADISYGPMLEVEGTRDVVTRAVQEAIAVARACGVSMPEDLLEHILNIPANMPNQKSSTAQDLARGKPSEIDFLNGYVVRKGAELGIPTPTNHALQVMVKLAERGKELSGGGRSYSVFERSGSGSREEENASKQNPGSGNLVDRHLVRDAAQRHASAALASARWSRAGRGHAAFSTTDSVTTIEREAARPWTREAILTVWPK